MQCFLYFNTLLFSLLFAVATSENFVLGILLGLSCGNILLTIVISKKSVFPLYTASKTGTMEFCVAFGGVSESIHIDVEPLSSFLVVITNNF